MKSFIGLLALSACSEPGVVVGQLQEVADMKATANRDLDLLFVVDNSPSMADKQVALAASFPKMMDVLAQLDGGLPNLHIGIVTSDMGTKGSAVVDPGPSIGSGQGSCAGSGDNGALQHTGLDALYIEDIAIADGSRQRNYTGALRDVFSTAALVGDGGCGFEQHLAGMRAGLTNPANAGFLRDSANLAVVILADEDDCSMLDPAMLSPDAGTFGPLQSFRCFQLGVRCSPDQPDQVGAKSGCGPRDSSQYIEDVKPFAQFLRDLKGDERKVMVAGIVGDPSAVAVELRAPPGGGTSIAALAHSCLFGDEVADPAVRLSAFLDQFPDRSTLTSICSSDLTLSLDQIGESAKKMVGDPCLDTALLADTSPDPGIQPACQVNDVRDSAPHDPTPLAHCATGAADCYELVADTTTCPSTPDHLRVRISRSHTVSDDTWTHVSCQLAR